MVLAQHPATEVLNAILPSEVCRIVCEFAAPHAAPVIKTQYRLIRSPQKEELDILAARWQVPCNSVQHIVEFSPNCDGAEYSGWATAGGSREIRISSSWTRERDRYGLGRKNACLCRLSNPEHQAPCMWQPSACPNTYGPISLLHLRSFRISHQVPANTWPQDIGELDGWGLFSVRRYQKWVWSIHDQERWIDESCEVNCRPPCHPWPQHPLDLQDKVKLLAML